MPLAPFLAPERDNAFKRGRGKGGGTTFYTVPGVAFNAVPLTSSLGQNSDRYSPFFVDSPIVVDQLAFEVTTGAALNVRVGIYPADTDWQPAAGAAPLADSGSISVAATGVKTYTPGTAVYLPRGRYLSVITASANGSSVRAMIGSPPGAPLETALSSTPFETYFIASRAYAAFPTPGTAWTSTLSTDSPGPYHIVVYRITQP